MSDKLYVGNLPYKATQEDLAEAFESEGFSVASTHMPTDRETGRPRGFGFVELEHPEDNQQAVEKVNGKELMGRALKVNIAAPKESFGGRSKRY